jgi:hypothetical protein
VKVLGWVLTILLAVLVFLTSCQRLTDPRTFGISRTTDGRITDGGLLIWYLDCYAPPLDVTLLDVSGEDPKPVWELNAVGPDPRRFPLMLRIGDEPPGYRTAVPLSVVSPADAQLEISFGQGEAYHERLGFRISSVPIGSVLTFDRRVITPRDFTSQRCEEPG